MNIRDHFAGFAFVFGVAVLTYYGTGLGLYICRELVTMHGGDMKIESVLGAGTRVLLALPKREAE